VRQWYADAAGRGSALADRLLRWYLHRHVEKLFARSQAQRAWRARPRCWRRHSGRLR
jgi:acetolactate synthase-1/2/3 large subunit